METLGNHNIILITLDGLRSDKIDHCSTLKSLKNESVYFSNMITVSPYTLTSLHAIFSGMYPSRNGVNAYYNMFKFRSEDLVTLPELLQKAGYYTSCDIISDAIIPKKGFSERNIFDENTVDFIKRHTELIRKIADKKFFLFLHYTEPHKHLVSEVIQKYKNTNDEYFDAVEENNKRYDSFMPAIDAYVNAILKVLHNTKIFEKTIIIFHADHGTSMGEKKGEKFYGVYVYDYTIKVFAIMKIPKIASQSIHCQCRTIDLYPTIAELGGIKLTQLDKKIQGQTLLPFITKKEKDDREVFVETGGLYGPWPSPTKHNVFCVRINNKKLIYNDVPQTWEFYNLIDDPHELKNIYDENLPEVKQMKIRLMHYFRENKIKTKLKAL